MRNIALDLAARKIVLCEVAEGKVIQRRTVGSLDALSDLLGPGTAPSRVAIEACREAWHVHDVLTGWGHEVLLVDTTRVKQLGIGQHGRKTDRIDAETLARAVERGAIPLAHTLSKPRQELRLELSVRRALVESRAQLIVLVRGLVRAAGGRLPSCDSGSFLDQVARATLEAPTRARIAPLLGVLAQVQKELVFVEERLERLCATEPIILQLSTVPGVGLIVAASFVSVIDEAGRFRNAHQVSAYLGLVPREDSSGDRRRLGSITKSGNGYVRSMLVQAAWTILRLKNSSDPLRRWADAVAKRRGKRVAVVALSRRLAGVLWAMWRDDTVYDAAVLAQESARGHRRHAQDLETRAAALELAAGKARRRTRRITSTRQPATEAAVAR